MTEAQKEYIITESLLKSACDVIAFHGQPEGAKDLGKMIRAREYKSDAVLDDSRLADAITKLFMKRFYGIGDEISDIVKAELRTKEREP